MHVCVCVCVCACVCVFEIVWGRFENKILLFQEKDDGLFIYLSANQIFWFHKHTLFSNVIIWQKVTQESFSQ